MANDGLAHADHGRSQAFFSRLFERYPQVLACAAGVHLIAHAHHWLPPAFTHRCIDAWANGEWADGPQAAGEIAMLRFAWVPDDEFCRTFVERALTEPAASGGRSEAMRVGVAYTAIELWGAPRCRQRVSAALLQLMALAEGHLAEVVLDVFRATDPVPPDSHTDRFLDALAARPQILQHCHSGFLVDRLKELLRDGADPGRVCRVAHAVLDESGRAVADLRTAWAPAAGDLVDIALTLQRLPQTRVCGMDLFERLMDLDAYKIAEALRDIDRRFPT
jgi:hypothetical protein